MKRILFLLFLMPVLAWGQSDSASLRVYVKNVGFQARDIANLSPLLFSGMELYEDFADLAKAKFRPPNAVPALTTVVTIDSIRVDVLIEVSRWLRSSDYGNVTIFFSRVDAAIKGIPNTFLQSKITELDNNYQNRYMDIRTEGIRRLKGQRN